MSANTTYRIRGNVQESTAPQTQEISITGQRRLTPGSGRDASLGEMEVKRDEVVRVELENGFVLWTRADDLIRTHGRETLGRDGVTAWEIVNRPPARGSTRGLLGLGIRVLDFFGVNLKKKAAGKLGKTLEEHLLKGNAPGLYRCTMSGGFSLTPVPETTALPAGAGSLLLFIHGTASCCQGSFGKLWETSSARDMARKTLQEKYAEHIYAWEHRSLTESPIRNALELVKRLPKNAELHLVSHSRGGLVGELLCLAERDRHNDLLKAEFLNELFKADRTIAEQIGLNPLDENAANERDKAYDTDREVLEELIRLLDEKQFRITRFVRVACPARGTTLASGRLDRWLSVLNHFSGNALVGDVADFMLAVVKERTDPRTLPGLEAMMPGSALTRLLQQPIPTRADLSVIAGDVEGDSLWGQIKLFASDWFYGADHDLVVNTGSMYGGLPRTDNRARFLRDQGPKVNHFSYFENDKSVRWLVAGLTRVDAADGGFQPIQQARREEPRWRAALRRSRAVTTPQPLAVVLPGTMGSELQVDNKTVWLDYWSLFWGGLKDLHGDAQGVKPTDMLDDFYGPLLEFLTRSHRVEIFPYDWRLSIRDAAKRLAENLEAWLPECERQKQPVHLVAHSMGGLVVRAMIADGGRGAAVWRRICNLPNSRFMMLGTPNLGSYEAVRWLTGYNATQAKLTLLDITHGTDGIIDLVRTYPGLVELLPFDAASPNFSQPALWNNLKQQLSARWQPATSNVLSQARATWDLLKQAAPDPQHMIYVAGCQDATVVDYQVAEYDDTGFSVRKRLAFLATREGDGTVAWKSGRLPGVPVWYVEDTAHDELCTRKRAFPGYLDLLMSGATARLPVTPPARSRAAVGENELFPMPALPPTDDIPAAGSLRGFGFGPSRPFDEAAAGPGVPLIQLSISHGNLAYAKHPVLVGHYLGDTIVSAEKAMDERLDNALSSRLQLGIYPGQFGTHALFFHPQMEGKPGGAVVVGLGQVGELSPGLLCKGVRDAMLHYALRVANWPDKRFGPADSPRSAALTCLLVGSGAGGIEVRDSVEAILRAAAAANAKLVAAEMEGKVIIDRLEFLELYEDVAISTAEALESVLSDGQLAQQVAWTERVIVEGEGGLRRVRCDEAPDWWQRLEIIEEKEGSEILRFIATTDRARAEETLATGQLRLADGFIRQASNSPAANAEVAKTLFEMLLPNRLKELAPKQVDLVLLVDEISARYPWELLEDRWSNSGRPPAIAAGLVRQLKTPNFRPHPAHATEAKALVIGNPDLGGWDLFCDLPGARQEAQKVAALLNANGYRAMDCIDETADTILAGLHKDAWRILHLAGHGEHGFLLQDAAGTSGKRLSGMVIGKNTFLTPGDVEQMRWVPELVFINCCHLGKTLSPNQGKYNLLAANLAVQFIQMGVKAVVAAGWAVDDAAGQSFAESFYTHMLAGSPFGSAVRAAREEIWVRFPTVNTWGAYQCYGDPGYRLHGDGDDAWQPKSKVYHAPVELIAELENQAAWIRMQKHGKGEDEATLLELRDGIASLLGAVPETQRAAWLARADVAAAVGFAWGETGAWPEAVEWLDKALHAKVGDCPIRAAEQCANFQVRLAAQKWLALRQTARGTRAEAERQALVQEIERAIGELDMISQRAPTPERLNLLGGACKRLAWVYLYSEEAPRLDTPRLEALVNMANYYRQAFELGREPDPYPFSNWAVAKLYSVQLDASQGGDWQNSLDDECVRMIEAARNRNAGKPNFWDAVGEADCELVRLLANSRSRKKIADEAVDHIISLYRDAARRGASPREYASVLEHLDFVIDLGGALPAPLRSALATIRAAL